MDRPSDATSRHMASPVVELRQYTLHPGQRETLIGLFDNEFIESQEATGMTVIGQFRDLDRPDMFVWMRGFEDMEARRSALTAFYDGPVWARHRDAANGTMIDSNDVLLLKPAAENASGENRLEAVVEVRIHHPRPGVEAAFARRFASEALPLLTSGGARLLGAFVSEHALNTFPRLPVRTGENTFIAVIAFDDEGAHAKCRATLAASSAWREFLDGAEAISTRPAEALRLAPTRRSLLR